jgi:hypothetical protein
MSAPKSRSQRPQPVPRPLQHGLSRAELAADAHAGFAARAGGTRLRAARAQLARLLWDSRGERKLPGARALDEALEALPPAELAWLFELAPLGPLYLLPTRSFVRALASQLSALGVTSVLEVAAGDGLLARALAKLAPQLTVHAADTGAWDDPRARMSAVEQRALANTVVPGLRLGSNVERSSAKRAIARHSPDLILCSWLPPGHTLLDSLIRSKVRYVLELGADHGVTASAYCWRFTHEFLEGPLEQTARCRLDVRPAKQLHSRATLYFGASHPEFHLERVRAGDWLHQFKPPTR